jgi:hypothetical protein
MMSTVKLRLEIGFSGRKHADAVSKVANDFRLVKRDPVLHLVAVFAENKTGVITEVVNDLGSFPAFVTCFKILRQVPMVERHKRLDISFYQEIEEIVVVLNSFWFLIFRVLAFASWAQTSPGKREAVVLDAQRFHVADVTHHIVVRLASIVSGIVVINISGFLGKRVPDVLALAVRIPSTFDLISRRGKRPLLRDLQLSVRKIRTFQFEVFANMLW